MEMYNTYTSCTILVSLGLILTEIYMFKRTDRQTDLTIIDLAIDVDQEHIYICTYLYIVHIYGINQN